MRARERQFLPEAIGQVHPRLYLDRHGLTVEPELHPHHAPPFSAVARKARSTRVATRPRRYAASACRSSDGSTSSAPVAAARRINLSSRACPFSSVSTPLSRCGRGHAPITPTWGLLNAPLSPLS